MSLETVDLLSNRTVTPKSQSKPPTPSQNSMADVMNVRTGPDLFKVPPYPTLASPHIQSPLPTQPTDANLPDRTDTLPVYKSIQNTTPTPISTPPRPKLAIDPNAPPAGSAPSPYTASPSGRLKLPASAIMRSRSSSLVPSTNSPSVTSPSPSKIDPASLEIPAFQFKSVPMSTTLSGGSASSRPPSRDTFKSHKGAPSLSDIRERLNTNRKSISDNSSFQSNGAKEEQTSVPPPAPEKIEIIQPTPIPPQVSIAPKVDHSIQEVEERTPPPTASTAPSDSLAQQARTLRLQHAWTLYFDAKGFKPPPGLPGQPKEKDVHYGEYEKSLLTVGQFDTVEGFARHFNNVKLPSKLALSSNYHMFKDGIKPMWEDPANANGGKWVVLLRQPALLDMAWANLTMALIGEMLDPEDLVCGIVVSNRAKVQRLQVWTRCRDNVEYLNLLGSRIVVAMGLEGRDVGSMSMEYQFNSNDQPAQGVYLTIPFGSTGTGLRPATFTHTPHTASRLSTSTNSKESDAARMPPPPVPVHADTMKRSNSFGVHTGRPGSSSGGTGRMTPSGSHHTLPVVPRSPGTANWMNGAANGSGSSGPLSPSFGSNLNANFSSPTGPGHRLSAASAFAGPMGGKSGAKVSPLGSPGLPPLRRGSAQLEGR